MALGPKWQLRAACNSWEALAVRRRVRCQLSVRGKKAFPHQERIGCDAQGGVVMKAAPSTAFVVVEAHLVLQFLVVALDPPSVLHDANKRSIGVSGGSVDSQYFVGSFSSLGHSINSHSAGAVFGWS